MQNTLALRLTGRLRERHTFLTDSALILGGSLLVAAMAQAAVYLPFSPVPVTGQTFAVLLVGMALGSQRGALALLLYLAEGALGLPFFAGGAGGPAVLAGPTGGYLVGFVAAAWVVGLLAERGMDRHILKTLGAFLVGSLVIYLFGVLWLSNFLGLEQAVRAGLLPFLVGDLIKALLAAAGLPAAWAIVRAFERP